MYLLDDNRFSKISFFVLFIIVILISFKIVSSFLLAIIVGAIFAGILKPLYNKLIQLKINAKLSAYLVLIFFIIIMIIPLFFFIQNLISEASRFTELISNSDISFSSIADKLNKWSIFQYFISEPSNLESQLNRLAGSLAGEFSSFALHVAANIPFFIIDILLILISIFIFLLHSEKIIKFIFR